MFGILAMIAGISGNIGTACVFLGLQALGQAETKSIQTENWKIREHNRLYEVSAEEKLSLFFWAFGEQTVRHVASLLNNNMDKEDCYPLLYEAFNSRHGLSLRVIPDLKSDEQMAAIRQMWIRLGKP